MKTVPAWHYDEFRQIGVDYADRQQAETYDQTFLRFRGDPAPGNEELLDALGVQAGQTFLDLGCGTGDLAIQAAHRGALVYAVDVSTAMLEVAKRKAATAGINTITFCHAGFLTYDYQGEPVDVGHSSLALHHLPDFWKLIGLQRVAGWLKDGGMFYLMDMVYSFAPEDYARFIPEKVEWFNSQLGEKYGHEVAISFGEELCTCDWIMEGLLTRAGFNIERVEYPNRMLARYWCR